ncbi:lecithin-cholesterol acyltransferase-like 1 [Andrographis paniculata]|uniref:lecithin-cholesterol acyltransferase-like 1 n=1 Tax=Andrographis paniculata TaxID=175694 RepID=UPI0021E7E9B7|nr:lecithin-cholesterol acyltransferase-like 1 [Andrographis paniculata]
MVKFKFKFLNLIHYCTILLLKMAVFSSSLALSHHLHPVVLIPGNGGNQLEARLTREYNPSSLWCNGWYPFPWNKDRDGWFRLWFDPGVLLRPLTKCFAERMTLYYDPQLRDYYNAPGVDTRVPGFGSIDSLLYLDPNLKHITAYMEPLVRSLEEIGYVSGENLFGAPYDFRYGLAAQGQPCRVADDFISDLERLVESAAASNGGHRVILVTHSLGGLFALHMLDRTAPSWHKKHIKHLITLSAPWGGTVEQMLTFASGNALGVPLVDPLLVRAEQRSSSSNLWLMPSPRVFGGTTTTMTPLVVTPETSYAGSDIARFLADIGFPEGVQPYEERIRPLVDRPLPVPEEVPVTCIVGSGVDTAEKLVYGEAGFDGRPEVVFGDGDGTVNMKSLLWLEAEAADRGGGGNWTAVKVVKLAGVSHTSVLKDREALDRIIEEIGAVNSEILTPNLVKWS